MGTTFGTPSGVQDTDPIPDIATANATLSTSLSQLDAWAEWVFAKGGETWQGFQDYLKNPGSGIAQAFQAAPLLALALATYALYAKLQENLAWNADLREHRQDANTFYQRVNATVIVGAILTVALVTLKMLEVGMGALGCISVMAGVTLVAGGLIAANYYVYQRSVQHDGR